MNIATLGVVGIDDRAVPFSSATGQDLPTPSQPIIRIKTHPLTTHIS